MTQNTPLKEGVFPYNVLVMFLPDEKHGVPRPPLFASAVTAGFPSPADDFIEGALDLNKHLVRRPAATFFVRVEGASMNGAGIFAGDLLIVDRSLEARPGHIVVAVVGGDLTVKRLVQTRAGWQLMAEHPDYPPIPLDDGAECAIWGVVTGSVRQF